MNLWLLLANRPDGVWQRVERETLLVPSRKHGDLWQEANDETLIVRSGLDLWHKIAVGPGSPGLGIWMEAADETLVLTSPEASVWTTIAEGADIIRARPTRRLGWALKSLEGVDGQRYYILKNLRAGHYLRLTEEQVFIWNLLDGEHTVQDIAVAYFVQYKTLAIRGLLTFLAQLGGRGFLMDEGSDVYGLTAARLGRGWLARLARRIWLGLTSGTITLRGVDGAVTRLYRWGGFLLFTVPARILILAITVTGLAAFASHALGGKYSVLTGGGEQVAGGVAALYVAQFAAIFIHEGSHALACKHFKREVRRAGITFYLGMPAFFVDTTDIWMETRKPRLLVSWAGPYSGFFLAGLASLLIFAMPSPFTAGLLFQFAFTCVLLSFTNLNPLIMLDGYFILMDWLESPMLCARAMRFAQTELWGKLRRREGFTGQERLYAIFGLLSLAWTVSATVAMPRVLHEVGLRLLVGVLGGSTAWIMSTVIAGGLAVALLWPFVRGFLVRGPQPAGS
jgi:putative peptide zinc metalloprotease protein